MRTKTGCAKHTRKKKTCVRSVLVKKKYVLTQSGWSWKKGRACEVRSLKKIRALTFKRALRLRFLLIFENLFCRFLTSKSWRDADMINPSIESSYSLFWHRNIFESRFRNFEGNRQSEFHQFKFNVCLHTHQISKYEILFVCFPQNF